MPRNTPSAATRRDLGRALAPTRLPGVDTVDDHRDSDLSSHERADVLTGPTSRADERGTPSRCKRVRGPRPRSVRRRFAAAPSAPVGAPAGPPKGGVWQVPTLDEVERTGDAGVAGSRADLGRSERPMGSGAAIARRGLQGRRPAARRRVAHQPRFIGATYETLGSPVKARRGRMRLGGQPCVRGSVPAKSLAPTSGPHS